MDEIKVMVKFTMTEGKLSFTDALYYDYNTYPSVKQSDVNTAKQTRFDNWKTELAKPQPSLDLDKAISECQAQIDYYTQQKASYQIQKSAQVEGK